MPLWNRASAKFGLGPWIWDKFNGFSFHSHDIYVLLRLQKIKADFTFRPTCLPLCLCSLSNCHFLPLGKQRCFIPSCTWSQATLFHECETRLMAGRPAAARLWKEKCNAWVSFVHKIFQIHTRVQEIVFMCFQIQVVLISYMHAWSTN